MSSSAQGKGEKPVCVVAGVGNGSGTGAATARAFAEAGYRVALIARNPDHLNNTAKVIKDAGGEAAPFPVSGYDASSLSSAFASIHAQWPSSQLKVAVYNAAHGVWKPFLELTDEDVEQSMNVNVRAAFAFARQAILAFQQVEELDAENGKRGTLIFTGATASLRGNATTSAFAAGKHGLRALSQSLNKEFGKQNIHVAHVVMDGVILTDRTKEFKSDAEWEKDENARLHPESIAKAYLYLANQDRSALTWELDLRPAHEKW